MAAITTTNWRVSTNCGNPAVACWHNDGFRQTDGCRRLPTGRLGASSGRGIGGRQDPEANGFSSAEEA